MPMFTTLRMRLPVAPVHSPSRTLSAKADMRSSTSCTWGTTSAPSTSIVVPAGARSATWSTARPSVTLIFSPENMASMRPRRPHSSARPSRRATVSSVTRFLE